MTQSLGSGEQRGWALDEMAMVSDMAYTNRLEYMAQNKKTIADVMEFYQSHSTKYDELSAALFHVATGPKLDALNTLLEDAQPLHSGSYAHSAPVTGNVEYVLISVIEIPLFRLGGIYSNAKLAHVLDGMSKGTPLPPMALDAPSDAEKKAGKYRYQVRDGIHRYYAAVKLGYTKVPAVTSTT